MLETKVQTAAKKEECWIFNSMQPNTPKDLTSKAMDLGIVIGSISPSCLAQCPHTKLSGQYYFSYSVYSHERALRWLSSVTLYYTPPDTFDLENMSVIFNCIFHAHRTLSLKYAYEAKYILMKGGEEWKPCHPYVLTLLKQQKEADDIKTLIH